MAETEARQAALARRVRNYRRTRGWTFEEMARHTRVSAATLNRIENGQHLPRRATLEALAKAMDRTVGDLMPPQVLEEEWHRMPVSGEVRDRMVRGIRQFAPRNEDDLWAVLPALCSPDWEVRLAGLEPVRSAGQCLLPTDEAAGTFLAMAAFDVRTEVRVRGEEIQRERASCAVRGAASSALSLSEPRGERAKEHLMLHLNNVVLTSIAQLEATLELLCSKDQRVRSAALSAVYATAIALGHDCDAGRLASSVFAVTSSMGGIPTIQSTWQSMAVQVGSRARRSRPARALKRSNTNTSS